MNVPSQNHERIQEEFKKGGEQMADDKTSQEVNYQPVAPDVTKSCLHCKHFNPEDGGDMGDCFGHKVSCKGTCNFWEEKV